MKKGILAFLTLALILCSFAAIAEETTTDYAVQTNSFWGADGGWMVDMNGGIEYNYSWMDNDAVAEQHHAALDAEAGALSIKTDEETDTGILYCMFDIAKLTMAAEDIQVTMKLYVSDAEAMKAAQFNAIELISGARGWMGSSSLRWTLDYGTLVNGWNELTLNAADAEVLGEGFNPRQFKFLWMDVKGAPADIELKVSEIVIHDMTPAK